MLLQLLLSLRLKGSAGRRFEACDVTIRIQGPPSASSLATEIEPSD